jgi:Glycosyl hydrolase family 20, catalytic domain
VGLHENERESLIHSRVSDQKWQRTKQPVNKMWMPLSPTVGEWKRTKSSKVRHCDSVRYCIPCTFVLVAIIVLQLCLWIRLQEVFHESAGLAFAEEDHSNSRVVAATTTPPARSHEQLVLPKLGVLLDTGRHDFSVDWIHSLIDSMAHLGLSLLHVRLSDDQRLVDPFSSAAANYWKDVVQYAKDRSIQILPELDVPSHALAWGDLAVACPKVTCRTAFGIPLNVSHPKLWEKLDGMLQWIVDTFEPDMLHMGGDEVHVNGGQCVQEATAGTSLDQDYEAFERSLGALLQSKFMFGPEKVLRWETTDTQRRPPYRYGNHTHYWSTMPITTLKNAFVSTHLYWDALNRNDYEPDAFRVYTTGRLYRHQRAIIAGTFELNAELWEDRNVMGKLVALSLMPNDFNDQHDFELAYNATCRTILPESTCERMGRPLISNDVYRTKHAALWTGWKRKACQKTQ